MEEKQKRGRPSLGLTYAEVRDAMDRLQNVTHVARELNCLPTLVHRILGKEAVGAEPMTEEEEVPKKDNQNILVNEFVNRIVEKQGPGFGKEVVAALLNKLLCKVA